MSILSRHVFLSAAMNHSSYPSPRFAAVLGLALSVQPALAGGFERAIASAAPRVVKLYGLGAGLQAGYGTGVVVSSDGLVLTVLSLLVDARIIRAVAADGTRYEAEVVHRDTARQLALLRLKAAANSGAATATGDESARLVDTATSSDGTRVGPLPFFDLYNGGDAGDGDRSICGVMLEPGDWVLAAGNPFKVADGPEPVSIAHGVFSTRTHLDARRRVKDFPYTGDVLVIDAITSNPGAEGSALVNLDGQFVGMIGRVVVSNLTHTHFNYAMPCDVLHDFFVEAMGNAGKITTPPREEEPAVFDAGIKIARTGYQKVLPFVERVRRNSPADHAGVRADDLVLSLNGQPIADVEAYDARMKTLRPRQSVELVVRRGRAILTLNLEPEPK